MSFYEDKRATADRLIRKRGRLVSLRVATGATVSTATGAASPGTVTDHDAWVVTYPVSRRRRADAEVEVKRELGVIMSAEGLTVVPSTAHRLVIDDVEHEITSVEPLGPGGIDVLYQLRVAL